MSDGRAETGSHELDQVTDHFSDRPGTELSGSRLAESTLPSVLSMDDNGSPNPGQAYTSEVDFESHASKSFNTGGANSARHVLIQPQARAQSPFKGARDPQVSQNEYLRIGIDGDPLPSLAVIPIFIGLFLYTLATLIVVAWYVAYTNDESTEAGIEAALAMAGILLIAAVGPIWDEYQRLAGS